MNPHTAESLREILLRRAISPWGELLDRVGDDAHAAVVAEALARKTGARGLRNVTTAVSDFLAFHDDGGEVITAELVAAALKKGR